MTILIVDDDKLTITALQQALTDMGYKVDVSREGEQAIQMINNTGYDLVICDVMMPGISGLSLVAVLRTMHLCFTPIIMMSTLHNRPLVDAAMKAGANDFIDKPVQLKELEEKVKKFDNKVHP
jgi:DNA-binding response OmpR family regulator